MADNGVVTAGGRLTDWVSLGVLAAFVPRDAVDDAVAAAGRQARRSDGKLPPHVMVYFVTFKRTVRIVRRRAADRAAFPPEHQERILATVMAGITRTKHLSHERRHRAYPRVIKRARHNSYRVKPVL